MNTEFQFNDLDNSYLAFDYDSATYRWKCSHCNKFNYSQEHFKYVKELKCIYCHHEFKNIIIKQN